MTCTSLESVDLVPQMHVDTLRAKSVQPCIVSFSPCDVSLVSVLSQATSTDPDSPQHIRTQCFKPRLWKEDNKFRGGQKHRRRKKSPYICVVVANKTSDKKTFRFGLEPAGPSCCSTLFFHFLICNNNNVILEQPIWDLEGWLSGPGQGAGGPDGWRHNPERSRVMGNSGSI